MLSLVLWSAIAAPPPYKAPVCSVDFDKARVKTLRDLGRTEYRDGRRNPALPGNKYRRQMLEEYLDKGWICSPEDALHASRMLVRTFDRQDRLIAYHLLSWAYAQGLEEAGPLAAAAYDQYLVGGGRPQWFGSQTRSDGDKTCLYPVDPAATDADRRGLGARPIDAVVQDVYRFTGTNPPPGASLASLDKSRRICDLRATLRPARYDAKTLYDTVSTYGGSFNHDGTRLLFGSNRTGVYNLFAMPVAGGELSALTESTDDARWAVDWFPTDDRFLFAADTGGDELRHLFVGELDGSTFELTPGDQVRASFVGWTQDHSGFYVLTNERDPKAMDAYLYRDQPGYPRERIFENSEARSIGDISPDGRWLVVEETHNNLDSDLYLIDLNAPDSDPTHLTPHEDPVFYGVFGFEPDSAALWYGTNADREFVAAARYDLATEQHELRIEADWDVVGVDFSDSGDRLAYRLNADAQGEVHVLDRESGEEVPVEKGLPDGAVTRVRFAPDGSKIGLWLGSDSAPASYFVAPIGGEAKRVLEPVSEVDPTDLVEAQVIRYESFDGLQIPALLYLPHTATPEAPVPAVVWVHGGPGGQSTRGYRADLQFLVNRGYAVLAVNNRGSSGYGKSFNHGDDRMHGYLDLKDCIAGRDYLASLPTVDGDRIGIMGGSYGGYMVLAALAFAPDAFEVGVDIFGVSNWVRTLQSIPPWWESFRSYLYAEIGDPVADREALEARSPLLHAGNITKPLFVVQGKNDPRVLEAESSEIVAAVKENGVPVEYLLFEDEGHGFVKTANQVEAAERWVAFLDRHLRP